MGAIANIVINYIFDPENPDFIIDEFLVAFICAVLITEINRKINIVLEKRFSWTHSFSQRFIYHLMYLTAALIFIINVIGNLYLWFIGDGFHTLNELLVINFSVFILAFLLTIVKWATHFYHNWRKTENYLTDSNKKIDELKSEIEQSGQQIELLKGRDLYRIDIKKIQLATIENGIVWVYFEETNKGVYQGTLNSLKAILPEILFYQATRSTIIRKDTILAISSGTYGKIDIKLRTKLFGNKVLTVSRPKASHFRKWYNSN
ncbi:LytTR family DNA-binding domain-containing protein [Flagellimonas sp. S174]|uniref:LytTR family DNA-binding domain-containing protein n=1 Tax=Flagellimonas sp. S174 TaxID=3410790 RepID=UPI003BF4D772